MAGHYGGWLLGLGDQYAGHRLDVGTGYNHYDRLPAWRCLWAVRLYVYLDVDLQSAAHPTRAKLKFHVFSSGLRVARRA